MNKKPIILIILLLTFTVLNAFSLKDGFKLALENDMDFKVNKNNLKNVKFDQEIAEGLLYPKIDFSAKVETSKLTRDSSTPKSASHTKTDEYKLTFTQPIFDGYESKNETLLQKERFKSAVYYLKESQEAVALNYTIAYVNTLKEKDLLNLSKESYEISKNIFNKVFKKVNSGFGTKLEFEEAKGKLAQSKVNLDIQRINLKEAIENLKLYVQADFDTSELVTPSFYGVLPKTLDSAIKIAYENNPSINVSKTNVNVSLYEEKKTHKEFYPDVNLIGSYQLDNKVHSTSNEYNEYKLGFELKYNLFNGGKNIATKKKALQNIKDKQLLIKKSQYKVKNKLRLAWNNYKLNKNKNESLEQYLIVKNDILEATKKEFDLGLKDLNKLQETHIEYIDVKKDLIRNTYDLLTAKYRILDAMGSLSDTLEEKLPTLDKLNTSKLVKNMTNENAYDYNKNKKLKNKKLKIIKPINIQEPLKSTKKIVKIKKLILEEKFESEINKTFKETFLTAPANSYTINLAYTASEKRAKYFLNKNNLEKKAFYFSFGEEKTFQKIMYGVYANKSEALKALKSLPKKLQRNKPRVEKVVIKQKLYEKYHGKFKLEKPIFKQASSTSNINNYIKKVALINKIKPNNKTSISNFKELFLSAPTNSYTINLAYTTSEKKAKYFFNKNNLEKKAFYFSFGKEKTSQKIMYGVYASKSDALKALKNLPKRLQGNKPRVEKVVIKQKLYEKYHGKYAFSSQLGRI